MRCGPEVAEYESCGCAESWQIRQLQEISYVSPLDKCSDLVQIRVHFGLTCNHTSSLPPCDLHPKSHTVRLPSCFHSSLCAPSIPLSSGYPFYVHLSALLYAHLVHCPFSCLFLPILTSHTVIQTALTPFAHLSPLLAPRFYGS